MKGNGKSVFERAQDLVGTSVEDLQASLPHYSSESQKDIEVVRYGLMLCERRGEKTKVTLLKRKLKKMEKEAEDASV
ncbi:MAG: hypothetical protein ACOYZ6_07990 [Chloroflexota bacterium]